MSFVPHSDADRRDMLAKIGVSSIRELYSDVPDSLVRDGLPEMPDALSEWETVREIQALADMNHSLVCFAGAGQYDHFVPAAVDHLVRRSEFYTAYTPYQPEVSQGTLQVIYEFQTMVCELTGMDVANASMYDGPSAAAEAAADVAESMIREKIADGVADIFRAESIVYRVAGLLDRRLAPIDKNTPNYYGDYQKGIEDFAVECAITKVYCSEALCRISDQALQIHGGYGFIQEYPVERFYRDARINPIYEGTNEINRLLISGTLLKRAMKGEIDLMPGVMKAAETLKAGIPAAPEATGPFVAERALLANLKSVFLAVVGSAVRKHMEKLRDEQEILMALADVAIEIFALESAVLRAGKAEAASPGSRADMMAAAVKVCACQGAAGVSQAAARAAAYIEEGKRLTPLPETIDSFCRYDPSGLLAAKRALAAAALEAERTIF